MKKLYNILFQNEDLGEKSKELYYRSQELIVALKNKIIISDKSRISFDTYFNSFSIDKWRKYKYIVFIFKNKRKLYFNYKK